MRTMTNKEIYDILKKSRCIHDFENHVGMCPMTFYNIVNKYPEGNKLKKTFDEYLKWVLETRGIAKPKYWLKSVAARQRNNKI